MHMPHRPIHGFFILLLFGLAMLVMLGTHPAGATSLSLPEAQELGLFETSGGKAANAQEKPGILCRLTNRIVQTWHEGNLNLIATVYAWHNRLMYDEKKIRRYNEKAWGGGLGKSIFDEDGDSHMLFVTVFNDSWKKPQYYGGYAFMKNWYFGSNNDFRFGAGISLGITGRHEYDYIPLPLPLPVIGIGYKQLSIDAAYIPGTYNNGNVLFTWVRWTFN